MMRASVAMTDSVSFLFDAERLAEKINAMAALQGAFPHADHLTMFETPNGWRIGIRATAGGLMPITAQALRVMTIRVAGTVAAPFEGGAAHE
jgi:hypothetical protein